MSRGGFRIPGWDLGYWRTGEWQYVQERLRDEVEYNPPSALLFAALRAVRYDSVRVAVLGQDPYPRRSHCTGVAFSTPPSLTELPVSLKNIFKEYSDDLGYPAPKNGDLTRWCERGVLLWNVFPSCSIGKPGSHHWEEWTWLTKEIVEKLDVKENPVVFVFLGTVARQFAKLVHKSPIIATSHPSALGVNRGFFGSRIFSRTNETLSSLGQEPIDWRLS